MVSSLYGQQRPASGGRPLGKFSRIDGAIWLGIWFLAFLARYHCVMMGLGGER
jgi:hypothetical protein